MCPPPPKKAEKQEIKSKNKDRGQVKCVHSCLVRVLGPRGADGRSLCRVLEGETTTKKGEKKTEGERGVGSRANSGGVRRRAASLKFICVLSPQPGDRLNK